MEELNSVIFEVDGRKFIIEFMIFTLVGLKCCHVEFGQKVGPFIVQFTLNNMSKHSALLVFRQVVRETVERYRHFDIVIFSSLDGNAKRSAIYDRISKDIAKREACQVGHIERMTNHKVYVLHRNCYDSSITEDLLSYLSKNGLFSIGGKLVMNYFKIVNFAKKFLYFSKRNA